MRRGRRSKAADVTAPENANQGSGSPAAQRSGSNWPRGARRGIMGAAEDPSMAHTRPWLLVLIAVVCTSAAVSRGATPPTPVTSSLGQRTTVELVLIEVYVTAGRGRPVRNLTEDDFTIML